MKRCAAWMLIVACLLSPVPGMGAPVYVCERPDGTVEVTHFARAVDDPAAAENQLRAARRDVPPPASCGWVDSDVLPARNRPDPGEPGVQLTQRHRWRWTGTAVGLNPSAKRPHPDAIQREYRRLLAPARWAEVVATPLGSALDQAIHQGRWADVAAILGRSDASQPLMAAEIARLRAILRDYEAD
mgnify:CR=1 FL=1